MRTDQDYLGQYVALVAYPCGGKAINRGVLPPVIATAASHMLTHIAPFLQTRTRAVQLHFVRLGLDLRAETARNALSAFPGTS